MKIFGEAKFPAFLFGVIAAHLCLALVFAFFLNIWADEASTLYTTGHGFTFALGHASMDEKQAPLYFWAMSIWRSVSPSVFFARSFSVLCTTATILIVWNFCRRRSSTIASISATTFVALHPLTIWAASEIRVYALVMLLSAALISVWDRAFLTAGDRLRWQIGLSVLAAVSLYTNYYLGFLLLGLFVATILAGGIRAAFVFIGLMIPAAIAFVPQALNIRDQFAINTAGYHEPRSLVEGIRGLWQRVLNMLLPANIFGSGDTDAFQVTRAWIMRFAVVVIAALAIARRRQITRSAVQLSAIAATNAACLLAAYFALGPAYVEMRHTTVLFIPLTLAFAALLSDITRQPSRSLRLKAAFAGVSALILVFFIYSLNTMYPAFAKRGDWDRVAAVIEAREKPSQPIVVFTVYDALALDVTYHGVNEILPRSGFFRFSDEAPAGTPDSLRSETAFVLSQIPPDAREIWLVTNAKCSETEACTPLENFIGSHYTVVDQQHFYLEDVRLLRKREK